MYHDLIFTECGNTRDALADFSMRHTGTEMAVAVAVAAIVEGGGWNALHDDREGWRTDLLNSLKEPILGW